MRIIIITIWITLLYIPVPPLTYELRRSLHYVQPRGGILLSIWNMYVGY